MQSGCTERTSVRITTKLLTTSPVLMRRRSWRRRVLEDLGDPTQDFLRFLDRGWVRRALLWSGQSDADRDQALRLSDRRREMKEAPTAELKNLLDWNVLDLGHVGSPYIREFLLRGAACLDFEGNGGDASSSLLQERPQQNGSTILCLTIGLEADRKPEGPSPWRVTRPAGLCMG